MRFLQSGQIVTPLSRPRLCSLLFMAWEALKTSVIFFSEKPNSTLRRLLMRTVPIEYPTDDTVSTTKPSRGRAEVLSFGLFVLLNRFDTRLQLPLCGRAAIRAKVIVVSAPCQPASSILCWFSLRRRAGVRTCWGTVSRRLKAELRTMPAFSPQSQQHLAYSIQPLAFFHRSPWPSTL